MASAAVEATASAERSSDGVASSSGDGCEGGGAAAAAAETAPPIAWPVRSDCRYAASYW